MSEDTAERLRHNVSSAMDRLGEPGLNLASWRVAFREAWSCIDELTEYESASLRAKLERAVDALDDLTDWQNGPPLITYTEGWNAAMAKAAAVLKENG